MSKQRQIAEYLEKNLNYLIDYTHYRDLIDEFTLLK